MKNRTCIMAVDDEPGILKLLRRILEPEGYDVDIFADGQSAVAQLENYRPDLVILDIMMPRMDGLEVLNLLRQRSDIPVIMLTGRQEVLTVRDALALGADDYVRKPFHPRELVARVRAKLRRSGLSVSDSKEVDV